MKGIYRLGKIGAQCVHLYPEIVSPCRKFTKFALTFDGWFFTICSCVNEFIVLLKKGIQTGTIRTLKVHTLNNFTIFKCLDVDIKSKRNEFKYFFKSSCIGHLKQFDYRLTIGLSTLYLGVYSTCAVDNIKITFKRFQKLRS